jgi:hypothetical protein
MFNHANAAAFQIHCDAGQSGALAATTDHLSARVGHVIRIDGTEQMWDFLLVLSKREKSGTLTTRVLLCHPHWDDPLEIAVIESDSESWDVRLGREEPVPGSGQGVT